MELLFVAGKLLSFAEQPLHWILGLLVLSVLSFNAGWTRAGRRAFFAALLIMLTVGITGIPERLLQWLEDRHPRVAADLAQIEGLIVLGGGAASGRPPLERDVVLLTSAAERLTETAALVRRHPHLKVLFTGQSGELRAEGLSEADACERFFREQGVPLTNVIMERQARNTHENAVFSARVPGVDPTRPWLLVTSARHMPRSYAVFRKAGWNVQPMPVDYATGRSLTWSYSVVGGAGLWQSVLHEMLGYVVYRVTGRL